MVIVRDYGNCDPIQNLSIFRMEANLLRAQTGQTGIEMAEALRYLKACHFNSTKALEIYKNYQVSPSHLQEWLLSGFCCGDWGPLKG